MPADYEQYPYITKRVRYFDTQFLKDQDFIDDQKYHLDRQRRSLRYLHISGIVEGLTVEPGDGKTEGTKFQAAIAPGTAIDPMGRQIVLAAVESVALRDYVGQTVDIFISYSEVESDIAQQGGQAHRRWHEKPSITVVKGDQDKIPEHGIRLARLQVNSSGLVTIDRETPNIRQYAGISLPSADNAHLTLRSGGEAASSLAVLTGSLSISDNVGIGTQFPKDKLSIQGGALSFSNENAVPQMGIDYDKATDTLRVRANQSAQALNTNLLSINRSTGNVSIGTTTTSGVTDTRAKLRITGGNLAIDYGETGYLLVNPETNWPNGTHKLIGVDWVNNTDIVKLYTPGSQRKDPIMVLEANGNITMGTSGTTANLDLPGHIQLKEYSTHGLAYIQARADSSNRDIGLRFRTQQKGVSSPTVIEALTIGSEGRVSLEKDCVIQGNVGIGTTAVNAKLEVKLAKATTDASLKLEHIGSNFIVRPLTAGGTSSVIENTGSGALVINPSGNNVGIGTTAPNARLEIAGTDGTVLSVGATSDSRANIDLCGHVQLKAYNKGDLAYIHARDDTWDGPISLRFRTQKAKGKLTEAMTINSEGNVNIAGGIDVAQKPIEIVTYTNVKGDRATNYSIKDWVCSIAGFASGRGDINEKDAGAIIHVYAYQHGDGNWHVTADFRTHDEHEDWNIVVMAIRKGIAEVK